MSDARAIEAVTETLRALVDDGVKGVLPGATAVARPLDQVNPTAQEAQVNLFLYQTGMAAELRNAPPPDLLPGEDAEPALPLVLRYLLTPFVPDGNDLVAHRLLGGALQALHTRPLLTRAELAQSAPYSDLARQVDSVRITWHAFEEKDIYSLWSVFQTPYRLTTAFEVRAVLIDSRRPARTPVPVLSRGSDGRGPRASADVRPTTPRVDAVVCPGGQPAARAGDRVELRGANLGGVSAVRLTHLGSDATLVVPVPAPAPGGPPRPSGTPALTLPSGLPAGVCAVTLLAGTPPAELPVGPWYMALAPRITSPLPATVVRDAAGDAEVVVNADPPFAEGQRVFLLLGGDAHAAGSLAGHTARFALRRARPGGYPVRLRVDGVDSLLVLDRAANPPAYDPSQRLTVI
ncbi:Pvc16 family protein [Streptomyces lavendulae]|uniref:DUF4255 domain-containing protein n=1 Tax=Streptomyces lavendulae TaxID=1914 RepID=UPI0024A452BE|nr:Pvc16 family protein [Streptomyces lavendulae]GLW00602.1 hypothetical protein Slala05_42330 [Streptomyces lavendulae subsp. lavendulae]